MAQRGENLQPSSFKLLPEFIPLWMKDWSPSIFPANTWGPPSTTRGHPPFAEADVGFPSMATYFIKTAITSRVDLLARESLPQGSVITGRVTCHSACEKQVGEPIHTQGKGDYAGYKQEIGIMGGHLRVCLPHGERMGQTRKHRWKVVSTKWAYCISTFTTHCATVSQ